jgi:hypothetical protein
MNGKLTIYSGHEIYFQTGDKEYYLYLGGYGLKLANVTDGIGNEIGLPPGFVVTHNSDKLEITNQGDNIPSDSQKITIPYGIDLTDYNKYSFRQSIIDNVIMANLYGNLYNKITDSQKYPVTIKSIVNDNIYPRITHTMFTLYYSSYFNTVFPEGANRHLLEYYTDGSTVYAAIIISVVILTSSTA